MKRSQFKNNKQQGFTIIELVVVILLLGILTATALPRFIDVTDEAHVAVVDAVEGGLGTGVALFRAQWFADNQPSSVLQYNNMSANDTGWPTAQDLTISDAGECRTIFQNLLQEAGRPTMTTVGATAFSGVTTSMTDANYDFAVLMISATPNECGLMYTGQFRSPGAGDVPALTYDAKDGGLSRSIQ